MLRVRRTGLTCDILLQDFHVKKMRVLDKQKLKFNSVDGRDVYNITAPFKDEGEWTIAGRVEERDSEESNIVFFNERNGVWTPMEDGPVFPMQDPFFSCIGGELVLGGVQTFTNPAVPGALLWRTVFYRGSSVRMLMPFFVGPDGMKDLRLVELNDGRIGVFTRPQGVKGGRGKIGFVIVRSLEELTVELIAEAPLLEEQFIETEWGGVNEARMLANGLIGVLGHIARFDKDGNRGYYPMVFALDPDTGAFTDIEVIAVRSNFDLGPAKRPDLTDVVFSGGLVRSDDGTAILYAGISDAEAHCLKIPDPFLRLEALDRSVITPVHI
ncbi:hypothetical protein PSTEL_16925 [Paenibacillus stellifer]|uniref:DUF1861 family protein n=1 Tax=Paenibacillus stellifer TaxID=169760 RepID=A0A089N6Y9_9BACL|nr:DUF1861 family protein [Paenibacillus stellifer]AIQ64529.1 hypothetical protein PSTEL_16925 [Paenibacillus stellifer]